MPGGRPPKFTPEVRLQYLALLSAGVGRRESAKRVEMSHRQVAAIRQADDIFRQECEDAEEGANEPVVLELYKAATRGEAWAVKMWLNNRDSGNWAEKVTVDQRVSGTVNVEAPGLADIVALEAALSDRVRELNPGTYPQALEAESWEAETGHDPGGCDACGKPLLEHSPAMRVVCERRVDELAGDEHLPPIGA